MEPGQSREGHKRSLKGSWLARPATASERTKRFHALFKRGKDKFERMDFRGAARDISDSLKLKPRHPEAYLIRSLARQRLRDEKGSSKDMEKYIHLKNTRTISLLKKECSLALAKGDMDLGIMSLEHAIMAKCDAMSLGLIERGCALAAEQDYLGAARHFTEAVSLNPHSVSSLTALGGIHINMGDFDNAEKDFSQALEIEESAYSLMCRGMCRLHLGNMQDALLDLSKALAMKPNSYDALFLRANALAWMNNYAAALIDAEKAIAVSPGQEQAKVMRGVILLNLGRNEEAAAAFAQLRKNPRRQYLLALALCRLGRFAESAKCIDAAIRADSKNYRLYLLRHDIRLSMGDADGAMADHDKAMTLKEKSEFSALVDKSLLLMKIGKYDDALESASLAIGMRPKSPEAYDIKGGILLAAGRNEEAAANFTKAISLNPKDPSFYYNRSMARFNMDEERLALEDIDAALAVLPNDIDLQYSKAQALRYSERWEEAIRWLSRLIRREPGNDQLFYDRAECHFNQGRFNEAIRDYRASIRINPYNAAPYNDLGYTFYVIKNYKKAILYLGKAVKLAENEAYIKSLANINIGLCMEEMGNIHEALAYHNMAVDAYPGHPESYYKRGELKQRIGDKEGAEIDFDKAQGLQGIDDE